jgi:ADP-heptose:LPS heptosyltransferase
LFEVKHFSKKTDLLQWLDRYAGSGVCFLLTLIRRVSDLAGVRSGRRARRGILFIKLAEQGSTVLASDALQLAISRAGREQVYLLVFEENRFIADLLGLVPRQNVLTIRTRSAWTMIASCLARLREIRRLRLAACVDLEFFSRFSVALAWLSGARDRSGFHAYFGGGPYRGDLLTHRVLFNPHLHTSRAFAMLVDVLECDPAGLPAFTGSVVEFEPPGFTPDEAERHEQREKLRGMGISGPVIILNPNAGDLLPLRKWAGENYVLLAQRLLDRHPECFVLLTGSPEEMAESEALVRRVASPRCCSVAGQTTLRQLMTLYTLADILVTNDSGPAHFAALTEIDVVVLFGPETPALFGAKTPRNHVLWAGLPCSPCVNAYNNRQTKCRDNLCMKGILVDQVLAAVERIYQRRGQKVS